MAALEKLRALLSFSSTGGRSGVRRDVSSHAQPQVHRDRNDEAKPNGVPRQRNRPHARQC